MRCLALCALAVVLAGCESRFGYGIDLEFRLGAIEEHRACEVMGFSDGRETE